MQKLWNVPEDVVPLLEQALNKRGLNTEQCFSVNYLEELSEEGRMGISSDIGSLVFHGDPTSRKEIAESIATRLNF